MSKFKVLAGAIVVLILMVLVVCNGKAGLYEQAPDVAYIGLAGDPDIPDGAYPYVAVAGQSGNEDAGR